ncbi:FprA family A-type flavoprotein [Butyrivibrio sp. MC2013]|uniref:FprA family A-type flavoprotein n=1 Tax=Butyrivibrio sp. MC2013 TaxID=1280686 RepID=UPI0003F91B0E|nr:FprA family A-type flavoprotein [Butyrivibrio sp. MC2013]
MKNYRNVTEDIFWIGASDTRLSRFENIFPIPRGVSYNSYAVIDEKICLFDTADVSVADQYIENLQALLGDRTPDYQVILHMEPDHCSQIARVAGMYPDMTLVGSAQAFKFLHQFFPELDDMKKQIVKEGDSLSTGHHEFSFVAAPMVHWPEVLFAYDKESGALFSADAFGTFGAIETGLFADEYDFEKEFLDDARRYYANIVGKFGGQVQLVLKKAAGLDIKYICPLHGPVWRKDISWFIDKYQKWSSYEAETDDILLVYGSLYGHTASAARKVAEEIAATGARVSVYDVSGTHLSVLIGEAWRCRRIVIISPTYNGGIYIPVRDLIEDMAALGLKNRKFFLGQNGTWAPMSGKLMAEKLTALAGCTVSDNILTITSALHDEDEAAVKAFAAEVAGA